MVKKLLIPALVVSTISMILLVLVTISTPTTLSASTPFSFVQTSDLGGISDKSPGANRNRTISSVSFGTWGYCSAANATGSVGCIKTSHGYSATFGVSAAYANTSIASDITIGSSWTRGLAVHVVAFVFALIALVLTAIPKQVIRLAAAAVTALSAVMALTAFAIDIALFIYVQRQMKRIAPSANTKPGAAFYMALIAIPIAVAATALVFMNYRAEKLSNVVTDGYDYPMSSTTSETPHYKQDTSATSPSAQKVLEAYEESKAT